jgi:hypothetical protein
MIRFLLLVILLTPTLVLSQSFLDSSGNLPIGVKEQISIKTTPKIPAPGENFEINIESFSANLNKAEISWTVNGSVELSGTGETTFNGIAPLNGNQLSIVITINKNGGGVLTETIIIAPAEIDIIYEAKTYTHPFYRGKSLHSNESEVRIVAFPNFNSSGNKISSDQLVYTWKVDKKVIQNQSGFGRNVLDYKGKLIARPIKVEVTVEALNSNLKATNSITLGTVNPVSVLYKRDPNFGTLFEFNLNGRQFILNESEIEIIAEPFFFSTKRDSLTNLMYNWSLNGGSISNFDKENSILFRREAGSSGTARISISTQHDVNILQTSNTSVSFDLEDIDLEDFEF